MRFQKHLFHSKKHTTECFNLDLFWEYGTTTTTTRHNYSKQPEKNKKEIEWQTRQCRGCWQHFPWKFWIIWSIERLHHSFEICIPKLGTTKMFTIIFFVLLFKGRTQTTNINNKEKYATRRKVEISLRCEIKTTDQLKHNILYNAL